MCESENYFSWNASQALYFDFWQKQSELAIPEVNNYGIKIKERLRCLLRFWIIVPVPTRFLFHRCHKVNCGKLRQIQLVTLFGRSPLEPDELCLLWNLIRSPVLPNWFQHTANNSVQMSSRFYLQSTPSFCTYDLAPNLSKRPSAGNYSTYQVYFLTPLLSPLLAPVPTKIIGLAWIWGVLLPWHPM